MNKSSLHKIFAAFLAAAVTSAISVSGFAATTKRSDSHYARELSRLGQVPLLKLEKLRSQGTALEKLYDAQLIYATWTQQAKSFATDRNAQARVTAQYLDDVNSYLSDPNANVDGFWALDQAKFILGPLVEPIVNRMEYWSNSAKDRKALLPLARMGNRLLTAAKEGLKATQEAEEKKTNFNEAVWKEAYGAFNETDYYRGYAGYFLGLALNPEEKIELPANEMPIAQDEKAKQAGEKAPQSKEWARQDILTQTADLLVTWADEDPKLAPQDASGIKYQCMLLRGKIRSEAKQYDPAAQDFAAAGESPEQAAPGWVRYQAHYQAVVNKMRKGDGTAESELELFKKWIATDPETSKDDTAKVSADMLHYRVAAARGRCDQRRSQTQDLAGTGLWHPG